MVCVNHHMFISGDDPADTGASGVEVSRNTTEFISRMGQEQFDMIKTNQVATITVKSGISYPAKVWVFLKF